jgi:hypothetical protein
MFYLAATQCDNLVGYHLSYERVSDGATFIDMLEAGEIQLSSYGSPYIIFNKTKIDMSGHIAYVTLEYTKTTD